MSEAKTQRTVRFDLPSSQEVDSLTADEVETPPSHAGNPSHVIAYADSNDGYDYDEEADKQLSTIPSESYFPRFIDGSLQYSPPAPQPYEKSLPRGSDRFLLTVQAILASLKHELIGLDVTIDGRETYLLLKRVELNNFVAKREQHRVKLRKNWQERFSTAYWRRMVKEAHVHRDLKSRAETVATRQALKMRHHLVRSVLTNLRNPFVEQDGCLQAEVVGLLIGALGYNRTSLEAQLKDSTRKTDYSNVYYPWIYLSDPRNPDSNSFRLEWHFQPQSNFIDTTTPVVRRGFNEKNRNPYDYQVASDLTIDHYRLLAPLGLELERDSKLTERFDYYYTNSFELLASPPQTHPESPFTLQTYDPEPLSMIPEWLAVLDARQDELVPRHFAMIFVTLEGGLSYKDCILNMTVESRWKAFTTTLYRLDQLAREDGGGIDNSDLSDMNGDNATETKTEGVNHTNAAWDKNWHEPGEDWPYEIRRKNGGWWKCRKPGDPQATQAEKDCMACNIDYIRRRGRNVAQVVSSSSNAPPPQREAPRVRFAEPEAGEREAPAAHAPQPCRVPSPPLLEGLQDLVEGLKLGGTRIKIKKKNDRLPQRLLPQRRDVSLKKLAVANGYAWKSYCHQRQYEFEVDSNDLRNGHPKRLDIRNDESSQERDEIIEGQTMKLLEKCLYAVIESKAKKGEAQKQISGSASPSNQKRNLTPSQMARQLLVDVMVGIDEAMKVIAMEDQKIVERRPREPPPERRLPWLV